MPLTAPEQTFPDAQGRIKRRVCAAIGGIADVRQTPRFSRSKPARTSLQEERQRR